MKRLLVILLFFTGVNAGLVAQETNPKVKLFNHTAGLQVNELIRQLIDLNNNNNDVDNPYLAVYSISHARTGYGLHAGLGYDYNRILNNDAPASRETKINNLSYRFGVEKKFSLSKKFEASASLDFTGNRQLDKTFSISITNTGSGVDSVETTVTEKTTATGYGPRFSLGFHLTERILLSTEATFYFSSADEKKNILVVDTFTDIFNNNQKTITTSNQNSNVKTDRFNLSVPVVLFLSVKF